MKWVLALLLLTTPGFSAVYTAECQYSLKLTNSEKNLIQDTQTKTMRLMLAANIIPLEYQYHSKNFICSFMCWSYGLKANHGLKHNNENSMSINASKYLGIISHFTDWSYELKSCNVNEIPILPDYVLVPNPIAWDHYWDLENEKKNNPLGFEISTLIHQGLANQVFHYDANKKTLWLTSAGSALILGTLAAITHVPAATLALRTLAARFPLMGLLMVGGAMITSFTGPYAHVWSNPWIFPLLSQNQQNQILNEEPELVLHLQKFAHEFRKRLNIKK